MGDSVSYLDNLLKKHKENDANHTIKINVMGKWQKQKEFRF